MVRNAFEMANMNDLDQGLLQAFHGENVSQNGAAEGVAACLDE